jgi:hypothetical protein
MRDRLHAYLGGIARENGMPALAVGEFSTLSIMLLSLGANYIASESCSTAKSRVFEMGQMKASGKGKNSLGRGDRERSLSERPNVTRR